MITDKSAFHLEFDPSGHFTRGRLADHADMLRNRDQIKAGDWTITMNSDRTEFNVTSSWTPDPSYKLKVGPTGVETTVISPATIIVDGKKSHFDGGTIADEMAIAPSQYEFAGLAVASSLTGLPVALLASMPQA